jgi:hypothetical protein
MKSRPAGNAGAVRTQFTERFFAGKLNTGGIFVL